MKFTHFSPHFCELVSAERSLCTDLKSGGSKIRDCVKETLLWLPNVVFQSREVAVNMLMVCLFVNFMGYLMP